MNDELLTAGEAAKRLGVSPQRLHQLDDVLAPRRVGTFRVYSASAVESLVVVRSKKGK